MKDLLFTLPNAYFGIRHTATQMYSRTHRYYINRCTDTNMHTNKDKHLIHLHRYTDIKHTHPHIQQ